MASDNDINQGNDYTMDDVTLESILAEYKGSAYINGDKKTPTELLNVQTERIIKEALGEAVPDSLSDAVSAVIAENVRSDIAPELSAWDTQLDVMQMP